MRTVCLRLPKRVHEHIYTCSHIHAVYAFIRACLFSLISTQARMRAYALLLKLVRRCVSKQEQAYMHASFTFLRACYFIQTCIRVHLCKVDTYIRLHAGKVRTYTNNCSYVRLVNIAWGWYLFEPPVPHQLCFLSRDKATDGGINVCGLTEGIRSSRYHSILYCRPGSEIKVVYPSRASS